MRLGCVLLVIIFAFFSIPFAIAQETTGKLEGRSIKILEVRETRAG